MNRRQFFATVPAAGLIGLAAPVIAKPELTFAARADELAEAIRTHFRPTLPEGTTNYSLVVHDHFGAEFPAHTYGIDGRAGSLTWLHGKAIWC